MSNPPRPPQLTTGRTHPMYSSSGTGANTPTAWAPYPSPHVLAQHAQAQGAGFAQMRPVQSGNQSQVTAPTNVPEEPILPKGFGRKIPAGLKGLFAKDLKEIMYGLGDPAPAPDTVQLMEDILIEYLDETISSIPGTSKQVSAEDLRRVLQGPGDERKLARLEELSRLQVEIKKARAIGGVPGIGGGE